MSAKTERTHGLPAAPSVDAPAVTAGELLRLIQGLYAIFWGLLTMAVVGTQMVVRMWLPALAELILVGAAAAVLVGACRLGQVRLSMLPAAAMRQRWQRRAAAVRATAMLQVYFAVLFCLWWRAPRQLYLLANAVVFLLVAIGFLSLFNRSMAVLAEVFGQQGLAREARWFNIGNMGLLLLPLAALILYVVAAAALREADVAVVFHGVLSRANLLIVIVLLLPFSLTLSLAWAAKDAAAAALLARQPPSESLS